MLRQPCQAEAIECCSMPAGQEKTVATAHQWFTPHPIDSPPKKSNLARSHPAATVVYAYSPFIYTRTDGHLHVQPFTLPHSAHACRGAAPKHSSPTAAGGTVAQVNRTRQQRLNARHSTLLIHMAACKPCNPPPHTHTWPTTHGQTSQGAVSQADA